MTNRIVFKVPDGPWLALDQETFDVGVVAGGDLMPRVVVPTVLAGPRLMTSEQLAAELNVPPTWLEEAARRNEIPSVRVGKYVRFDINEVLTCLNPRLANR